MSNVEIYEIKSNLKEAISIAFSDDKYRFLLNSELIDVNNRFRIFVNEGKVWIVKKNSLEKGKVEIKLANEAYKRIDKIRTTNYQLKVVVPQLIEIEGNAYLVSEYLGNSLQECLYNKKINNPLLLEDLKEILNLFFQKDILYRGFLPRNIICKGDILYLLDWEDTSFKLKEEAYVINKLWETNFLLNWGYFFNHNQLKDIIRPYQNEINEPPLLKYEACFCKWTGIPDEILNARNMIEKYVLMAEAPISYNNDDYMIMPNDLAHLISDIYNTDIDVLFDITSYVLRNKSLLAYEQIITKLSNAIINSYLAKENFSKKGLEIFIEMINLATESVYFENKEETIKALIANFDFIPPQEKIENVIKYIDSIL